MSDYPWYMNLFNIELLESKKKHWEQEAKEKGMSLEEYLDYKSKILDIQQDESKMEDAE